jgi:hypothetical protein
MTRITSPFAGSYLLTFRTLRGGFDVMGSVSVALLG